MTNVLISISRSWYTFANLWNVEVIHSWIRRYVRESFLSADYSRKFVCVCVCVCVHACARALHLSIQVYPFSPLSKLNKLVTQNASILYTHLFIIQIYSHAEITSQIRYFLKSLKESFPLPLLSSHLVVTSILLPNPQYSFTSRHTVSNLVL